MSTNEQTPKSYTEVYKKLIRTKCPEVLDDPQLQVFASIVTSLAERHDALERAHVTLKKSVKVIANMLREMAEGDDAEGVTEDTVEGEAGATTAAVGGAGGAVGASAPKRDERYNVPFPAGVPSSKAEADAQAASGQAQSTSTAKTGPVDSAEDLTPNVGGSGAVNPQPIPNGTTAGPPNQSRVVNVRKNGPSPTSA